MNNTEFEKELETLLQKYNLKSSVFVGVASDTGNIESCVVTVNFQEFNLIYTQLHLMLRQMEIGYRNFVSPKVNLHVIKED